jgi:hypothetical protein
MVLHDCVKQNKKYDFYLKGGGGGGRFHNGDRPTKWPITKNKTHQNMHPQLINMDLQEGMVTKGI